MDKRTTELDAAGALDLTELIALVQAGVNKKITLSNLFKGQTEAQGFALTDESTSISAGTNKVKFSMPFPGTLVAIKATLGTEQSSGAILTIDLNKNGASMLSTKVTIDNNEKSSDNAAAPYVISDAVISDTAEYSFDVDQAGTGGKSLKVWLYYKRT
jgi:hypothetical protein